VHISKLAKGKRIKHTGEVLAKGQTVEVRIETVDAEKKRISLSLVGSEGEENEEKTDDYRKYLGGPSRSLGSWGDMLKGKARVKPH
ncbi:MAG: S1 RNA-binding domain-containing protein, partial [Syntrophales bacterium]|nr:S1 RNA-binding domain-containing protein [Syntrophales bacterium]